MPKIAIPQLEHAKEIAYIHRSTIPGLLSKLTPQLIELYYENACQSEDLLLKILLERDTVIGFYLAQTTSQFSHLKIFLKSPLSFLIKLLSSPKSCYFIIQAIFLSKNYLKEMPKAKLVYLAVHKKFRSKGLGEVLFSNLRDSLGEMKMKTFGLLVEADNTSAFEFYKKQGGFITSEFRRKKRKVYTLEFEL